MRKHAAKNTLTVAAAAMLALAATGCTSGEQHSAHVTWLSESAGDPIWSIEANTFDDKPVIVGDVVLGLVTERPQLLELAAWDLKTGQELWKRKVSPGLGYLNEENESYDSWGVEVVQSLDDGKPLVAALNPVRTVVYDTKDDTGTYGMQEQTISFLDPKTGEEVAESESAYRVLDEFRASNFGVGSEVASINLDTFVPLDEGMEWTKK